MYVSTVSSFKIFAVLIFFGSFTNSDVFSLFCEMLYNYCIISTTKLLCFISELHYCCSYNNNYYTLLKITYVGPNNVCAGHVCVM